MASRVQCDLCGELAGEGDAFRVCVSRDPAGSMRALDACASCVCKVVGFLDTLSGGKVGSLRFPSLPSVPPQPLPGARSWWRSLFGVMVLVGCSGDPQYARDDAGVRVPRSWVDEQRGVVCYSWCEFATQPESCAMSCVSIRVCEPGR